MKKTIFTVVMAVFMAIGAYAQFSISTDVVSRYVWRGTQFSASAIQPGIGYSTGGFSAGAWGSYDLVDGMGTELDLYAGYDFDFGLGLIVTDYFFPMDPFDQMAIYEESGSITTTAGYFAKANHTLEIGATYSIGGLSLGVYKMLSKEWSGAEDMYVEASYAFNDNLSLTVGAGDNAYSTEYGQDLMEDKDNFEVCNIGLSYGKEVALTETWSVSPFISFILNPNAEQTFLVVGVSF